MKTVLSLAAGALAVAACTGAGAGLFRAAQSEESAAVSSARAADGAHASQRRAHVRRDDAAEARANFDIALRRVAPPFAEIRTIDVVVAEIREVEALRLEAYRGASGAWLIGYGHNGGVTEGMTITEVEAEALLREDVLATEREVRRLITVPVNENEFSALVDLAYNIGTTNFANCVLLQRLNAGDREGAADAFRYWDNVRRGDQLVELPVLAARRARNREIFLTEARVAG